MSVHIDAEMGREIALERLMEQLAEALHEFWSAHETACEYEEDMLPDDFRNATHRAIMKGAKAELEKKNAARIGELDGDSRYSYTLRCRMIEHFLGQAAATVEKYFEGVAYV